MAGLIRTGTKLVAEGGSKFISLMQKAGNAIREQGDDHKAAARGASEHTAKAVALGTVLGNVVSKGISAVSRGLVGLFKESINVVSAHEKMSMSFTSLIAKEIKATGVTDDMTVALGMAGDRSKELLDWVQMLAIQSPFDQGGVAQAFKTALAYGFTSDEAQRLTAATIDFTTATGASGHVMDMAALALGQIKAKGKLAGGEMLQLVNTGINVNKILQDLGYTMDDVSKGLVSADEFLGAFVSTLESDFGGAAKRSGETVSGLINSLDDLKAMALRELFGPALQAMLPYLAQIVGKFQEWLPAISTAGKMLANLIVTLIENRKTIMQVVTVIGSMVAGFFLVTTVIPAVIGAVTAVAGVIGTVFSSGLIALVSPLVVVAGLVAALGGAFGLIGVGMRKAHKEQQAESARIVQNAQAFQALNTQTVQKGNEQRIQMQRGYSATLVNDHAASSAAHAAKSRSWGENIIIQFAKGMATALSAVIQVLNEIGNAIAHWLAPGSPPKLLPNIDKWGTAAMGQFLGGMTSANFGLIEQAARPLEGFFKSLSSADMPEVDLIPTIQKTKGGLMVLAKEYQNTGKVANSSFQQFFNTINLTNREAQGYVRSLFGVQMAQEKLNTVTKKYADMLNPMQAELDAIAQKRQDYIDSQRKQELQSIVDDANAPKIAKELALMELRELELQKQIRTTKEKQGIETSAAQAELDAAAEKLAMQEALLEAQREANEAAQSQQDLLDSLEPPKEDGAGGAESGGGGGAESAAGGAGSVTDALGGEGIGGIGASIGESLNNPIQEAADSIKNRLQDLVSEVKAPFANIGEKVSELGRTWLKVFDEMRERAAIWKDSLQERTAQVSSSMLDLIKKLGENKETWRGNFDNMRTIAQLLKEKVDTYFKDISKFGANLAETLGKKIENIKQYFNDAIERTQQLKTSIKEHFEHIQESFTSLAGNAAEKMNNIKSKFQPVTDSVEKLKGAMKRFAEFLKETVFDFVLNIPEVPDWAKPGSPIPLHTAWKNFGRYIKTARFEPAMDIPAPVPIMPTASPRANMVNNTYYNNQQYQGVGGISVGAQDDLIRLVEQAVQQVFTRELS